jgi:hypothetical protein
LQSGLTQRDMWVMHSPAGGGGGGGVSQITAGHAARTRCWFRLRQVGVGACRRTLPATAPACYAHHWERTPPARQQCLAPLHQIAIAGTVLSRRLPPPAGTGGGGGVSPNTAGHSTSVLRSPLGARAFGAPTVPRAPAPDRNSGNHPVPQTPAPSGGGLGWGRVANHCRTRSSYTLLVSIATSWGGGVSQNIAGHSTSVLRSPLGARASGAPTVSRTPTSDRNSGNHPAPATPAPGGGGWGWGRVAEHCRPQHQRATLTTGSARLRRANSVSHPCIRSR